MFHRSLRTPGHSQRRFTFLVAFLLVLNLHLSQEPTFRGKKHQTNTHTHTHTHNSTHLNELFQLEELGKTK